MFTLLTPQHSFAHCLRKKSLFLLLALGLVSGCKKSVETEGLPIACPTIVSTDPLNGSTNVLTNKKITATFNKAMDAATINGSTFLLTQGSNQIAGTVTYTGATASFEPAADLLPNTKYTGTITTGSKDPYRNAMVSNYTWSFTTSSAPVVTSTDPANAAANVALNKIVSATFNRSMNAVTINTATFLVMQGGTSIPGVVAYAGTTATFTPTNPFTNNTVYTATITNGAKDSSGNALSSNYTWSFSTLPSSPPPPQLGAISQFGVFGGTAGVTNEGLNTMINNGGIGTIGASTLITGFHDGMTGDVYTETPLNVGNATGGIFAAPPAPGNATSFTTAQQAMADANNLYNSISPASKPGGIDPGAGELGGLTLSPGVYKSASGTFDITNGDLILDGKGDPNAVWIFQTASGLTVGVAGPAGARSVKLINGAQAKNVFWHVGSAATINGAGGGVMTGTIIASAGVTFSTSGNAVQTVLNGRALSLNASVTMVNTTINVQ
ncbi:MAG TPA: ice-binding family protein [Chitinophagaceae bacterium]|nr:ice-binding family protein [Chitinophagaceae bacterium]